MSLRRDLKEAEVNEWTQSAPKVYELLLSRAYGIDLVPDCELEYDDTATSYLMVQ
ncbi:MAG: hypothetical protein ACRD5J_10695 [Nitrososphaeraceae archaeon]